MNALLKITFLQPGQFLWNFIYKNRQFPIPNFKYFFLMFAIISCILSLFLTSSIFGLFLIIYLVGGLGYLFDCLKDYVFNKESLKDYRYQFNYQSLIQQFKEDLRINFLLSCSIAIFNFNLMQTSPAQEIYDGLVFIPMFILFIYFWDVIFVKVAGNIIKLFLKN